MIKILHITPNLGGGVGKVLLNYLSEVKSDPNFLHGIACLDYANEDAIKTMKSKGVLLQDKMSNRKQELLNWLSYADVVLIHWWNHPLLYDFLVREELPPCRVIMWSHTSGFNPPYVFTEKILEYPDLFVFTTPISYGAKEVQNLSDEQKKGLRVVWSTGGVKHAKNVKLQEHTGFNVGYIGTVDFTKMHSDFLNICDEVSIPGVHFIVVGEPNEEELRREAERRGIGDKFTFTGLVSEETKWSLLSSFDVFGYPLAPYHYGTCDQVLQESMAVGIVPVVLNNPMERSMVHNYVTGIVAKNKEKYIEALEDLRNLAARSILSKNAKEYASNTFSLKKMISKWSNLFNEVLNSPKTIKKWSINKKNEDISSKDIFLESLGNYGNDFESKIKELAKSPLWQSETKGTVHHYHSFFKDDIYLSEWSKVMKEEAKNE